MPTDAIVATAVEVPRPKLCGIAYIEDGHWGFNFWTDKRIHDPAQLKHLNGADYAGAIPFIIPGSSDAERMTEKQLNDAALDFWAKNNPIGPQHLVAFAKSFLGVVEDAR